MDTKSNQCLSIPIYYDSDSPSPSFFNPFMVAPYKDFQDTIIFGPTHASKRHDDLVNALYAGVEGVNTKRLGATVCTLGDHCCFTILLPLSVPDNAGRLGRTLAIGFMVASKSLHVASGMASAYLSLIMRTLNSFFVLALPASGADQLYKLVNHCEDPSFFEKFRVFIDVLRFAGSEAILTVRPKIAELKRPWWDWRARRRHPRVILFSRHMDEMRMVELFFQEAAQSLRRSNLSAVLDEQESPFGNDRLVTIGSIPTRLKEVSGAEVHKVDGDDYICVY